MKQKDISMNGSQEIDVQGWFQWGKGGRKGVSSGGYN